MSWWESIERAWRLGVKGAGLALGLACAGAGHAAGPGCDAFKWPLERERAAFAAAGLEAVASGAARGALREQAFVLTLAPAVSVVFALPPEGRSKAQAAEVFAGVVAFDAPSRSGTYQVTLSGESWIDVVQNGAHLKSTGHTGARDCPGLRKSVRFELGAAPATLQVSGVPARTIKVAIRPIE